MVDQYHLSVKKWRIFLNIVATYGLDEFVKVFAAGYGDVNVFAMV